MSAPDHRDSRPGIVRDTARWYLSTWKTPEWRTVFVLVAQGCAMVAWFAVNEAARSAADAGQPWSAVFPVWALRSLAPALAMVALEAFRVRQDGAPFWRRLPAAALGVGGIALGFAAAIAAGRDAVVSRRLLAAALLVFAAAPLASRERGRFWWLRSAVFVAGAIWLAR